MNTTQNIEITRKLLNKWQEKIDLLNESLKLSATLIMKLHPQEVEILVRSKNEENPFRVGDKGELNIGAYCDSVVASKQKIKIQDATRDQYWNEKIPYNNGMESYLGLPLLYPNKDLFGTLCAMNQKARKFSALDQKLFEHFRESIEADLIIEEQNEIIRNAVLC